MSGRIDVQARLKEMGFAPKRSLGQNFLVSESVIGKITGEALRLKPSHIIEVGPGLGALTETILKSGSSFQVVELDTGFAQYWRGRGLNVTEQDALQVNWEHLSLPEGTLLLSNLPYQIASRMIVDRSVGPLAITRMVLMLQKEVAQRVTAQPRTKDYGFLSVIAQVYWQPRLLCDAGPNDFYPAPNVASRVLVFERRQQHWPLSFVQFVKTAFTNRRKYMMKNYTGRPELLEALKDLGHSEKTRAEELSPTEYLKLFEVIRT